MIKLMNPSQKRVHKIVSHWLDFWISLLLPMRCGFALLPSNQQHKPPPRSIKMTHFICLQENYVVNQISETGTWVFFSFFFLFKKTYLYPAFYIELQLPITWIYSISIQSPLDFYEAYYNTSLFIQHGIPVTAATWNWYLNWKPAIGPSSNGRRV